MWSFFSPHFVVRIQVVIFIFLYCLRYLQDRVVRKDGVFRSLLRGLFWPFGLVVGCF